jgi:hypothetical protein
LRAFSRICGEVGIARRFCETVFITDDGRTNNLHWKVEVTHHTADDCDLLKIFLPKDCNVRICDIEEFRDYSADATEMDGALCATVTL